MVTDHRRECDICDFHGPELQTAERDFRELHRALHYLFRPLIEMLTQVMEWMVKE